MVTRAVFHDGGSCSRDNMMPQTVALLPMGGLPSVSVAHGVVTVLVAVSGTARLRPLSFTPPVRRAGNLDGRALRRPEQTQT